MNHEENNPFASTDNQPPSKRVKISSKRQISIPKEFYEAMNLGAEAIIEFNGNALVIKQVPEQAVDLSSEILQDLVEQQGLSGRALIMEFNRVKRGLPHAIDTLKATALAQPTVADSTEDYLAALLEEE